MNVLNFRLSSWYSSGVFVLIMIILTSILVVGVEGVSSLIITLFSSVITLSIPYSDKGNYNDLLIVLNIKSGAYNLDNYSPNIYNLFI